MNICSLDTLCIYCNISVIFFLEFFSKYTKKIKIYILTICSE